MCCYSREPNRKAPELSRVSVSGEFNNIRAQYNFPTLILLRKSFNFTEFGETGTNFKTVLHPLISLFGETGIFSLFFSQKPLRRNGNSAKREQILFLGLLHGFFTIGVPIFHYHLWGTVTFFISLHVIPLPFSVIFNSFCHRHYS